MKPDSSKCVETPQLSVPNIQLCFFVCGILNSFLFCAGSCSSSTPKAASSWAGEAAGGSGDYVGVDAALPHWGTREESHFCLFIVLELFIYLTWICVASEQKESVWSSKLSPDSFSHLFNTSSDLFTRCFDVTVKTSSDSHTNTREILIFCISECNSKSELGLRDCVLLLLELLAWL